MVGCSGAAYTILKCDHKIPRISNLTLTAGRGKLFLPVWSHPEGGGGQNAPIVTIFPQFWVPAELSCPKTCIVIAASVVKSLDSLF